MMRRTLRFLVNFEAIAMPALSPSMETGDLVKEGELFCTVQTDKAVVDYTNSFDEGYLAKIFIQNGESSEVGKTIAVMVDDKADLAKADEFVPEGGEPAAEAGAPAATPAAPAAAAAAPAAAAPTGSSEPPAGVTVENIAMPALSPSMESGTVVEWKKKVGDLVKEGELFCTVQTDKAVVDYTNSFDEGYLAKIYLQNGESCEVGKTIAVMVSDAGDVTKVANYFPEDAAGSAPAAAGAPASAAPAGGAAAPAKPLGSGKHYGGSLEEAIKASGPSVIRIAAGLEDSVLHVIAPSGKGGRFLKSDFAGQPGYDYNDKAPARAMKAAAKPASGGSGSKPAPAAAVSSAAQEGIYDVELQAGPVVKRVNDTALLAQLLRTMPIPKPKKETNSLVEEAYSGIRSISVGRGALLFFILLFSHPLLIDQRPERTDSIQIALYRLLGCCWVFLLVEKKVKLSDAVVDVSILPLSLCLPFSNIHLSSIMSDSVAEKLRRQVEFYFSDVNIAKDVFLRSKVSEDAEGFVPLSVLLTFNRVSSLSKEASVLADALRSSTKLVLNNEGTAVRRKDPLPESIQTDEQTVYVKPVPPTSTLEELTTFFGQYGTVLAIWRRYFQGQKSAAPEDRAKPSIFVVFSSKEEAEKFQAAPPQMNGTQLTAVMKKEYLEQKAAEFAAKSKNKKAAGTASASANKTPAMPLDSSYKISGCGDIEKFSDVKGLWPAEEQRGVRYVFTPSKDVALLIFQDPATATSMVDSLKQRSPTLNGKVPEITKIEGDEEKTLIENVEKEIAERAQHSQGGRGRGRGRGRGGKRPRD
eukprot:gene4024-2878_t